MTNMLRHIYDQSILQCLQTVKACPICKQSCSNVQVRPLYLSAENCNNNAFEQSDLVQGLQDKINELCKALDQANNSLVSSKTSLRKLQDKCQILERDHQRKDTELYKAVERITQLTEINRNNQLAYKDLLEENRQCNRKLSDLEETARSSSQDQWWKQLKEEKDDGLETEMNRFVSKQKQEQKKRKLTYHGLQALVNDSIAKNKEILKENATKSRDKPNDLRSTKSTVKGSIKTLKSSWNQVEEEFEEMANSYNHVKKELDCVVAKCNDLDKRIVKFHNAVQKTRSVHEEMQQKMDAFNTIANRNDQTAKIPRVRRRSDSISVVVFCS
jgi:chromosome segregation ATPase